MRKSQFSEFQLHFSKLKEFSALQSYQIRADMIRDSYTELGKHEKSIRNFSRETFRNYLPNKGTARKALLT
jgi:hypothetical protein